MKVILILVAVIVLGIFLAYKFGGVGSFDPQKQADEFSKAIQPGMTWRQVHDKQPPKKFAVYSRDDTGTLSAPKPLRFELAEFEGLMKVGFPNGFDFIYAFSPEHTYNVRFGSDGAMRSIEKAFSLANPMLGLPH